MLCSHCNKREANFHYKQVNNGNYTELHLCSECAKELGYLNSSEPMSGFGLNDMLSQFLGFAVPAPSAGRSVSCKFCGTAFDEFKRTGLLGCDKCYDEFKDIENILSTIQPSTVHKGRISGQKGEKIRRTNELKELKDKLKSAVLDERYEEAAKIRDEIKAMEEKMKGGSDNG